MNALAAAQHEAAHVVVGVALGLRLHIATATRTADAHGYTWFPWGGTRTALSLMYSAGIAWELEVSGSQHWAGYDAQCVREIERSAAGAKASLRAARALLFSLGSIHTRVTRALLVQDIKSSHVLALARGERLPVSV